MWPFSIQHEATFKHRTSLHDTSSAHLQVDGSPFHFAGFNNYYMPTYAADQNLNERTQDVDVVFA